MDEEQKDETVEAKTETVEENTETVEEKPNTLPDLVAKLREDYENRLAEMEAKHAAAIADRDAIIQQLISGNPSGNVSNKTFVDRINEKRNFKKW